MQTFSHLVVVLCIAVCIDAQFILYPDVSSKLLAAAFNISSACLTALNATVDCDQDLFSMAGNADAFFWSAENATALCTSACQTSASSWWSNGANACANDQLNAYGRLYPAETIPGRFLDGMNIVCVTANTDITRDVGINGTILTASVVGDYNSTYTGDLSPEAIATLEPVPYPDLVPRQSSDTSQYCLIQSYDWTGSDIIRPDCTDPANAKAPQCIDPTDVAPENERIANLYPNDLLCSKCFLNMFYLRLASPYLPDLDHSDYLVEQWFDILDVCNATSSMPDLLVRTLPFYQWAPGDSQNWVANTTYGLSDPEPLISSQTNNVTCQARTIVFADLTEPTINFATESPCDVMSQFLNASTGDVWQMFGNPSCMPDFNTTEIPAVCAPLECSIVSMNANITCDEFVTTISTSKNTVTATQFLSWNRNLIGLCDSTTAQYVCGGAPGGTYISPPASNATTDAGSQQRGGGDGSGTATGSGGVGGSARNSTIVKPGGAAPSPTQSGISPSCTQYALAQSGDGCYSFSQLFDITPQALELWNPVLGPSGESCSTDFFAGYWYCIGVTGTSTVITTPIISATASATPSPVQSGIDPQCTEYSEAVSGDDCTSFASENSITPSQLYSWNSALGSGGANCGSAFWANYYYCVGAPGSSPTSTSSAAVPGPTQSGLASNCNRYARAVSGDTCSGFAQEHGITTTDLYAWNTVLGPNGANCNTELFVGYSYCTGVSGTSS